MADEDKWAIDSNCLQWKPFEAYFTFSHDNKRIHYHKASAKVAIGVDALDFSTGFLIEFVLRPAGTGFSRAIQIGISDQPLYKSGFPALLGSTKSSWGWNKEGKVNHNDELVDYSPSWGKARDNKYVVQMEYSASTRSLRFLENGIDRGVAFHLTQDDISQTLYPAVCFASSGHEAIMRTEGVGMMIKPAKRG